MSFALEADVSWQQSLIQKHSKLRPRWLSSAAPSREQLFPCEVGTVGGTRQPNRAATNRMIDDPFDLQYIALEVPSDSDFGRGWHQLLSHICHLSASAPTVLASEDVRRQYSRTMIEMLVQSAPHNYSAALEEMETVSHPIPWHVRRARDYVHNHIAASIGTTTRTLQIGFRKAFNMTPAQYIRRTRVEALHQALLGANEGQSVTDLMRAVGIVNFGRYARYYRQQVGVVPSVTLKRNM